MKLVVSLLTIGCTSAFAPAPPVTAIASTTLSAIPRSRKEVLSQIATISLAVAFAPSKASAAKYGSFGAGSPAVLDPKEADVDYDILKSDSVQTALKKVKKYQTAVREMQAALKSDSQVNLKSTIVKDFDFATLRETLNTLNTAFEEDTQRGTDRLIRAILQDLTELEVANNVKEGVQRSPRRLEIMEGKLAKLDEAFTGFLAFAN